MRVAMFYHSLVSDWNHGNAHFLRGVAGELVRRGHEVAVYEPADGWSLRNLLDTEGEGAIAAFHRAYPSLNSRFFELGSLDLEAALDGVDLALVHEWNTHELVRRVGAHHARHRDYVLLFHDTHHRAVSERTSMATYDLRHYDGVLAFGGVLRDIYAKQAWCGRAWSWHEAADVHVFHPQRAVAPTHDLVWVGNWGDEERERELREFLIGPVRALGLRAAVYGVRYPERARAALAEAGIELGGWVPNFRVPELFARARVTVHVPRGPYVRELRGIPSIRVFEALACAIPLVCAPWEDSEHLFTPGRDYLIAQSGAEMTRHLRAVLAEPALARSLAEHGRQTILSRHTCAHRVDELFDIVREIRQQQRGRDLSAARSTSPA